MTKFSGEKAITNNKKKKKKKSTRVCELKLNPECAIDEVNYRCTRPEQLKFPSPLNFSLNCSID